jgi:hypothetical protein
MVEDDNFAASGVGAGQAKRKVVGLGARAHEKTHRERVGKRIGETHHVFGKSIVEIAGVGVQDRHLTLTGFDHTRMAMAHVTDVVDEVEIAPT